MTAAERRARRVVDLDHARAVFRSDPVAFMRQRQAAAERAYAASGHADDLAVVRAYAETLDPTTTTGDL